VSPIPTTPSVVPPPGGFGRTGDVFAAGGAPVVRWGAFPSPAGSASFAAMTGAVTANPRLTVAGGCHCRAVRFEADVPAAVEVLACNCSICAATGFRHLIVPHADFRLLSGGERLTSYRFGTGAANHLFCAVCGIKSFYQPRSHPDAWSVNLNALDDPSVLAVTITRFDGRDWEAAKARLDCDG
jgi:hypothetical protein